MTALDTADLRVAPICTTLDLSADTRDTAVDLAARAEQEHPINRTPAVVAAAAVYAAGLLCNEKRTQQHVADAADVSTVAIRDAYRELLEHEGYTFPDTMDTTTTTASTDDTTGTDPVIWLLRAVAVLLFVGGVWALFGSEGLRIVAETTLEQLRFAAELGTLPLAAPVAVLILGVATLAVIFWGESA